MEPTQPPVQSRSRALCQGEHGQDVNITTHIQWRTEWGFGLLKHPINPEVLTKLTRNSLKVPKIKKILLYEMKFLVPNYNCL
jgi:hypothetical protein